MRTVLYIGSALVVFTRVSSSENKGEPPLRITSQRERGEAARLNLGIAFQQSCTLRQKLQNDTIHWHTHHIAGPGETDKRGFINPDDRPDVGSQIAIATHDRDTAIRESRAAHYK